VTEEVGALRRSTQGRLSVLDEVLRVQARYRRTRRAAVLAALLLVVVAVLPVQWPGPSNPPLEAAGPAVYRAPLTVRAGAVTGYIQLCQGLPVRLYTSDGARVFSAAATVEALPGREYLKPVGHGTYRLVLPTVVAARERVSENQKFRLDRLAPGRYVILAQYAGGNATTFSDVSVAPGTVAEVDLPNMCK
jgi:hypothetical protein